MLTTRAIVDHIAEKFDVAESHNFCLIAHIDHGKTTLADALVSSCSTAVTSNHNLISKKSASSNLRFLDYRPDEQQKGITMKTCGVTLLNDLPDKRTCSFFLLDSPGHVDFCNEVQSAVELTDCALLLVDAVEGVCAQTITVLRQAWFLELDLILVITKVDKLITFMKMESAELNMWILQLIDSVNQYIKELIISQISQEEDDDDDADSAFGEISNNAADEIPITEKLKAWKEAHRINDVDCYFDPNTSNNVIFCSSNDRWAFRPSDFAEQCAQKLGVDKTSTDLEKYMYGSFRWSRKDSKVVSGSQSSTIFENFVLRRLIDIYKSIEFDDNGAMLTKVQKVLGVVQDNSEFTHSKLLNRLRATMEQYLPIGDCFFSAIREISLPPNALSAHRIRCLVDDDDVPILQLLSHPVDDLTKTVILTTKLIRPPASKQLLAVCRIFSGRVAKGDILCIVPNDRSMPTSSLEKYCVRDVSVMFGRDVISIYQRGNSTSSLSFGCFCCLTLDPCADNSLDVGKPRTELNLSFYRRHVTLISEDIWREHPMAPLLYNAKDSNEANAEPIVAVAVDPIDPAHFGFVGMALRQLASLDSACLCGLDPRSGQWVLRTSGGQLQMTRALTDLHDILRDVITAEEPVLEEDDSVNTEVEMDDLVIVSAPRVEFRETLSQSIECYMSDVCEIEDFVGGNALTFDLMAHNNNNKKSCELITEHRSLLCNAPSRNHTGPSNNIKEGSCELYVLFDSEVLSPCKKRNLSLVDEECKKKFFAMIRPVFVAAFKSLCDAGPLCSERLHDITININVRLTQKSDVVDQNKCLLGTSSASVASKMSGLYGQLLTIMRRLLRSPTRETIDRMNVAAEESGAVTELISAENTSFSTCMRLCLAEYRVLARCVPPGSILTSLATEIRRRYGRITKQKLRFSGSTRTKEDASSADDVRFDIFGRIPVCEATTFVQDVQGNTGGIVLPSLQFAGWKTLEDRVTRSFPADDWWSSGDQLANMTAIQLNLDEDPNTRVEENRATKLCIELRKSKGLPCGEQLVLAGDKQRNISKKK